jgi:hypothetical protein
MTKKAIILYVKESVAKSHGYPDNILGTAWNYAMMCTHRHKAQLKLYEEVCFKLLDTNS